MEWDMAILEDCLDCDRKLLMASGTLPETFARLANALASGFDFLEGLFLHGYLVSLAKQTAVRANSAVRPAHSLKVFAGLVLIRKVRFE